VLPERTWNLPAVVRLLMLVFISLAAGSLLIQSLGDQLSGRFGWDKLYVAHVVSFTSLQGLALVWISLFVREHCTSWHDGFGFKNAPGRSVVLGVVTTLVALPIATLVIGGIIAMLLRLCGVAPEVQETVTVIQNNSSPPQLAVLGGAAVILAPLAEEAMFRGILYPTLKQRGYPRLALWGTAFLFGAIHFNLAALLPLTFLALVFTWLYEHTGNLLAPIAGHCLFNALNFYALVNPPKWLEKLLNQ
jgi:membrane protease YdiL (CAAX protease family)